jgi:MYXO-CTERM domain-containing protein
MNVRFAHIFCAALMACSLAFASTHAEAASYFFSGLGSDGHPISGQANFTLNAGADTILVKLTNSTATTLDAGELFTGLDFNLGGLTPTMTSDTGIQRTVDGAGALTDTGSAQNLSWSLATLGGGSFQLNFTPGADDGIIGPPTAGSYGGANGSIKGNAGHNPFAAQMAEFVLSVPNLEANTPVSVSVFRFGTTLDPANVTITPEPSAAALAIIGLSLAGLRRRRPRQ